MPNVPAKQSTHEEELLDPRTRLYLPGLHSEQVVSPCSDANVPGRQSNRCELRQNDPGGHGLSQLVPFNDEVYHPRRQGKELQAWRLADAGRLYGFSGGHSKQSACEVAPSNTR